MRALRQCSLWEAEEAIGLLPREPAEDEKKAGLRKNTARSPAVGACPAATGHGAPARGASPAAAAAASAGEATKSQWQMKQATKKLLMTIQKSPCATANMSARRLGPLFE